jgi:hypothetical protein
MKMDKIRDTDHTDAKQSRSYAWAYATDVADIRPWELSDVAYRGLDHAQQLADSARTGRHQNLRHYTPDPPPLTIHGIAEAENVPAATIGRRIAQARRELFGRISDNAIHKRQQRARTPRPSARVCAEPDCRDPLPADAHGNRRYCDHHRTPAARTRRHRLTTSNPSTSR